MSHNNSFIVRAVEEKDQAWIACLAVERWGALIVVAHGKTYRMDKLPGFIAQKGEERIGLVTYSIGWKGCEIVTLDSLQSGLGVGSALIQAVREVAQQAGCRRIWLVTTNDNLRALGFYQKRGFRLKRVHRNALARSRRKKPSIPLIGAQGIPLHDEIELEMKL